MSLFNAITHDGSVTRPISRYGGLALVLGVAVAIAAALALTNDSRGEPADSATAVVTNWQANRFIEINTTGLEFPASPAAVEPRTAGGSSVEMGSKSGVDQHFIEINTSALDYPLAEYTESALGPR